MALLTDELKALWTFDEASAAANRIDSVNGYALVPTNNPARIVGPVAAIPWAVAGDLSDVSSLLGDASLYWPVADYAFSLWWRQRSFESQNLYAYALALGPASGGEYMFELYADGNSVPSQAWLFGLAVDQTSNFYAAGPLVSLDVWNHYAVIRRGQAISLYQNGALAAVSVQPFAPAIPPSPRLALNCEPSNQGTQEADTDTAQLILWHRALGQPEVLELYNAGAGRTAAYILGGGQGEALMFTAQAAGV